MAEIEELRKQVWKAHSEGDLELAERGYRQLLQKAPEESDAINLGALLRSTGRQLAARVHYHRWIGAYPQSLHLRLNAANCLRDLDDAAGSLEVLEPLIRDSVNGQKKEVLQSLAKSLLELNRLKEAHELLKKLVQENPEVIEVWLDLGVCCCKLSLLSESLEAFDRAQAINPKDLRATSNRITVHKELGSIEHAEAIWNGLDNIEKEDSDIMTAQAGLLSAQRKFKEASEVNMKLVEECPRQSMHLLNLSANLRGIKQMQASHKVLQKGLKLEPNNDDFQQAYAQSLAERGQQEKAMPLLKNIINKGLATKDSFIFNLQFLGSGYRLIEASQLRELAIEWEKLKCGSGFLWPDYLLEPLGGRRIRVGYLSGDFCNHPVARFMKPILENHNRDQYEIWGINASPSKDMMHDFLKGNCEHWLDIVHLPDDIAARLIADLRLDVIVELGGFSCDSRLAVLARKPAPVQLSYLGYFAPTYMKSITGWIGDEILFDGLNEVESKAHKMLNIKGGYMAYAAVETVELGHNNKTNFCFGSFNHARKITQKTVELWMEVLNKTVGANLVLKSISFGELEERERVKQIFLKNGLQENRLTLLEVASGSENHMKLYREIDVALDPIPYGGATSTCEALWMGVPVVCMAGEGMVGRLSASVLMGAGCKEWIGYSKQDYVDIAVELASEGKRNIAMREELRQKLKDSDLNNANRLCRELERIYKEERHGIMDV